MGFGGKEGNSHYDRPYFWYLCLAVSIDSKLVWSGSYDCTIRVWNLTNCKEIAVFPEKGKINRICLIKNGHSGLTVTLSKVVRLWSLAAKQPPRCYQRHPHFQL